MADPENVLSVAFLQPQLLQWYSAYLSTEALQYVRYAKARLGH